MSMSKRRPFERPSAFKYSLAALFSLLILILLWMWVEIELFGITTETGMDKLRWIAIPTMIVALTFSAFWITSSRRASAREQALLQQRQQLNQHQPTLANDLTRREYVLEVIGLGITVDKYRQTRLWEVLQGGSPYASIREQDPKKYEWSGFDKKGVGGGRACDALENGAGPSPMFWGAPTFYAGSPIADPAQQPSDIDPVAGLAAAAPTTGMAWHLFVTAPWQLDERPDQLLAQVFEFFDAHPDVPYVVLSSEDSMGTRDSDRPRGAPRLLRDGYYIPEMPDASAVFVLARRERIEPMRSYAWEDPDNEFLQETLRRTYIALEDSVPTPEKLAHPEKHSPIGRQPTVAEWLPIAAAFAKRPEFVRPEDGSPTLSSWKRWLHRPPRDWKPTPWFPVPWNRNQLAAFDRLPTLGYIHRPVFVKFEDEHGKAVTRRDQRQKILDAGWQQALQTLPEAARTKGPARIVGAFGDDPEQQLALEGVLFRYAEQGGPEIDTGKTAQFINTDRRLGNTGAATFFVQMALGVMGSYNDGGTSAEINLRDKSGASIVFISPPSDEKRKAQGTQFRHQVEPAIDPKNYEAPAVEALLSAASGTANASESR